MATNQKPLTPEKAIEYYTELQRRVQVGAYLELQHDGSYPEDDGSPESTTLESIDNLETWARNQGLQFSYTLSSKTYELVKIAYGPDEEGDDPEGADFHGGNLFDTKGEESE